MENQEFLKLVEESFNRTIQAHKDCTSLYQIILQTSKIILNSFENGGKLLIIGNGGSATDASHMASEFIGRFKRKRKPLPAIALTTDTSIITAVANDFDYDQIFVKQCIALAKPNDVVMAISTSGNSTNVIKAVEECKKLNSVTTIGLTGEDGGKLALISYICIKVPSKITATIQEVHRTIIHVICDIIDQHYAKK